MKGEMKSECGHKIRIKGLANVNLFQSNLKNSTMNQTQFIGFLKALWIINILKELRKHVLLIEIFFIFHKLLNDNTSY